MKPRISTKHGPISNGAGLAGLLPADLSHHAARPSGGKPTKGCDRALLLPGNSTSLRSEQGGRNHAPIGGEACGMGIELGHEANTKLKKERVQLGIGVLAPPCYLESMDQSVVCLRGLSGSVSSQSGRCGILGMRPREDAKVAWMCALRKGSGQSSVNKGLGRQSQWRSAEDRQVWKDPHM